MDKIPIEYLYKVLEHRYILSNGSISFIKNVFQSPLSLTWLKVNTVKLKEESNAEPWLLRELYSEKIHVSLKRVVLIEKVISVPQKTTSCK